MGSPAKDREETLFLRVLGTKSPVLRILDFLMDNKAYDYSKIDIAKGAGVSRRALSSAWKGLEKNGLAKGTRKVGRAKMYKIDLRNPVVKKLIELDNAICAQYASQLERQEATKNPRNNDACLRPLLT